MNAEIVQWTSKTQRSETIVMLMIHLFAGELGSDTQTWKELPRDFLELSVAKVHLFRSRNIMSLFNIAFPFSGTMHNNCADSAKKSDQLKMSFSFGEHFFYEQTEDRFLFKLTNVLFDYFIWSRKCNFIPRSNILERTKESLFFLPNSFHSEQ